MCRKMYEFLRLTVRFKTVHFRCVSRSVQFMELGNRIDNAHLAAEAASALVTTGKTLALL